jgi:hypothetical protein
MAKKWFKAYATGLVNNSPRANIDAERIVVVLGEDPSGRPLEISISLEQSDKRPDELVVFVTEELWFAIDKPHVPELIMHKYPTTHGTGTLSVRFWPVATHEGDPPA